MIVSFQLHFTSKISIQFHFIIAFYYYFLFWRHSSPGFYKFFFLFVIFFSSLNIFKAVILNYFSSKSNTCVCSVTVSIVFFLLWTGYNSLFFHMPHIFFQSLGILNIIMWQLWWLDSIPSPGFVVCAFCGWYLLISVAFLNYFVRFVFFLIYSHWSLFYFRLCFDSFYKCL